MAGLKVGLDLGGTKCLGVALDEEHRIVAETRRPTPDEPGALLDALTDVARELERLASPGTIEAVGVGAPGLVDRRGVLQVAPNLPGANGMALKAELETRLGVPVDVDNDCTVAAWGEHRLGAARGREDVVMLTLGTGIGGGIVAGGRLSRGTNGFAGEVGHMVVDPDGPPCPCGRQGCWERFASGGGLARLGREAAEAGRAGRVLELAHGDPGAVRGEHVTQAVAEGDPGALEVMDLFCWWVAVGLANLANIFDPEVFVLGGGLIDAGESLLVPTQRVLDTMVVGGSARPLAEIVFAALGERAGAVGAACLR